MRKPVKVVDILCQDLLAKKEVPFVHGYVPTDTSQTAKQAGWYGKQVP